MMEHEGVVQPARACQLIEADRVLLDDGSVAAFTSVQDRDLEPGQGTGARKSWKAVLLDFAPWMHIS